MCKHKDTQRKQLLNNAKKKTEEVRLQSSNGENKRCHSGGLEYPDN